LTQDESDTTCAVTPLQPVFLCFFLSWLLTMDQNRSADS
jgi:hypothetical protein